MRENRLTTAGVIVSIIIFALLAGSTASYAEGDTPEVSLKLVAEGLTSPVALVSPRDGSNRLFVADQVGLVKVISSGRNLIEEPFLDLREKMVDLSGNYDERGLLGLAFHPDYEKNGRFYVYYSVPTSGDTSGPSDHVSRVSEFRVSEDDPGRADPASEKVILEVNQPQMNHNGGELAFGPDGYLYIGLGDGGGANDVAPGHPKLGNGQDITTLKGSILRIDVDESDPYGIPSDNPFVGTEGRGEIFAFGLRNPWRFSFDSGGDRELFAADVGQNLFEEVDKVRKGGNYGWNVKEGFHCFDPESPDDPPKECSGTGPYGRSFEDPIMEYAHPGTDTEVKKFGISITGGYVYRGNDLPEMKGKYVFGDWSSSFREADATILVASPPVRDGGSWSIREVEVAGTDNGRLDKFLLAFGRDAEGGLYALTTENTGPSGTSGKVYRLASPAAKSGEEVTKEKEKVTFKMEAGEWYFEPEKLTLRKGQEITIELKNSGSFSHNLKVGEFDAKTETIGGGGETASVTFEANKAGRFKFWCAVPGHRGRGMEGTLIVKE